MAGWSGSNGTRRPGVSGANPWQGVADAASGMAKRFSDPTAMDGMNAIITAHTAITALGQALSDVGKTVLTDVAIDPRVASYLEGLGDYVKNAADPTREVGDTVRRAHAEKMRRIEEGDRREQKWDMSANPEYRGGGGGGARHRRGA